MSEYQERRQAFGKLIERYADGRQVCNCGQAYYTNCGHALIGRREVFDSPTCLYGCSTNQISAKEEVALRVLKETGW